MRRADGARSARAGGGFAEAPVPLPRQGEQRQGGHVIEQGYADGKPASSGAKDADCLVH